MLKIKLLCSVLMCSQVLFNTFMFAEEVNDFINQSQTKVIFSKFRDHLVSDNAEGGLCSRQQQFQGPTGATGPTGPKGPQGSRGDPGARGKKGEKGHKGERGPRGEKGEHGERGPRGERGRRGFVGPTGPVGPQGESGINGENGENGLNGLPGATGPTGPTGATGPSVVGNFAFEAVYAGGVQTVLVGSDVIFNQFYQTGLPVSIPIFNQIPLLPGPHLYLVTYGISLSIITPVSGDVALTLNDGSSTLVAGSQIGLDAAVPGVLSSITTFVVTSGPSPTLSVTNLGPNPIVVGSLTSGDAAAYLTITQLK